MDATVKPSPPLLAIFHEQAKSIIAIRELQSEVSSLLEFKNALLETFPHLHHKGPDVPNELHRREGSHSHHELGLGKPDSGHDMSDDISTSWNVGQTNTGSMPRLRKLRKNPQEGSSTGSTVADSGFSTGTSSLPSPCTGGKGPPVYPPVVRWDTWTEEMDAPSNEQSKDNGDEDELMFLLDIIHRKVSKIRNEGEEVERRQLSREESRKLSDRSRAGITLGAISENDGISSDSELKTIDASGKRPRWRNNEGTGVRSETEFLADRNSELELETIRSHTKVSNLESELSQISKQKELLEDKLRTAVTHKSELDTKIHDMNSQTNTGNGKDVGSAGIIHSVSILTGGVQTEPSLKSSEGNSLKLNEFRKVLNQSESNPRRIGEGVPEGAHGSINIKIIQPDMDGLSRSSEQLVNAGEAPLSRIPKDPVHHSISVVNLKASSENLPTGGSFSDINALTRLRTNSTSASTGAILRHSSKPSVLHSDRARFFQNKMAVPPNKKVSPQLNRVLSNEKLSPKSRSVENLYEQKRLHLKPTISEMSLSQKTLITSSQGNLSSPQGSQLKTTQSEQVLSGLGENNRLDTVKRMRDPVVSMPAELSKGLKVKPNRERITQILSTNSVLELQRQLLTTVMENEVYKTQMSRVAEGWNSKIEDFEKVNSSLQANISRLKDDNHRLRIQVEEKSIELEGTKALLRQIEKDQPTATETRSSIADQIVHSKQIETEDQFQDTGQGLEELIAGVGEDNYDKYIEVLSAKKGVKMENIRRTSSQSSSDAKQRLQEMAGQREALSSNSDTKRIFKKPVSAEAFHPTNSSSKQSTLTAKMPVNSPWSTTKFKGSSFPHPKETTVEIKPNKQENLLSRLDSQGSGSNKSAKNSILILQNNSGNQVEQDTLARPVTSMDKRHTSSAERFVKQETNKSNLNMNMAKDSRKTSAQSPPPLHLDHSLSSMELRHMERDTIAGLINGILQKYTKKEEGMDTRRADSKIRKRENNSFVEIALAEENREEKNENLEEKESNRPDTSSQTRLYSPHQRPESQFMSQKSWEAYNHIAEETHGSHGHLYELATQKNTSRRGTPQQKRHIHTHVNSFTHPDSLNEYEGTSYQSPHLSQDSLHQVAPKDNFAGLGSPDDVDSLQFRDSLPPSKEGLASPLDSLIGLQPRKDTELYDSISSSQGKQTAAKRRIIPYHDDSLSSGISQDTESLESTSLGTNRTTQVVTGGTDSVPQPDVTLAIHHITPSGAPIRPLSRRYSTNVSPPQPDLRIENATECLANDPGVPQQAVQNSRNLQLYRAEVDFSDTQNQRTITKEKSTDPQKKSYVPTANQATEKLNGNFWDGENYSLILNDRNNRLQVISSVAKFITGGRGCWSGSKS